VQAQEADPASMLHLYRAALRLRRSLPREESLAWESDVDSDVLVFRRPAAGHAQRAPRSRVSLVCAVNLGDEPVPTPAGEPLLLSGPLDDGLLPPDAAGWWGVPEEDPA
jgi:alpha-glucosidase